LRILDRYIAVTFITTFGVVLFFILGIFVVLNLFSLVDSLLENREMLEERGYSILSILWSYYLVSIPFILQQLLPFVTLIAGTITLIRLIRGNEIVPMIAAGHSPTRIAMPIYFAAALLSLGMLAMQEWAVPRLADARIRMEWLKDGNFEGDFKKVPPVSDGAGNRWSMKLYNPVRVEIGR